MIKVDNIDVWGFEHAIRGINVKGYRRTRNGKYETFVHSGRKTISLGTYENEDDAKEIVIQYRIKRFIESCEKLGLNASDGIEYERKYVAFPSGTILNYHGKMMVGAVDRCGYRHILVNGKNQNVHRIIAKLFIPNPNNLPQVNHKDGNKLNNAADNLEWCTRSDNLLHAYRNGLEKRRTGEEHHSHKLTSEAVGYIRKFYKKRDKNLGAIALAKKFGVDRTTILDVVNGKSWNEVSV